VDANRESIGMGAWLTCRNVLLPKCVTTPNLVVVGHYGSSIRTAEIIGYLGHPPLKSIKVIKSDMDRSLYP